MRAIIHRVIGTFTYNAIIPGMFIAISLQLDSFFLFKPLIKNSLNYYIWAPIFLSGCFVIILSLRQLTSMGEGSPNPYDPPQKLVTDGTYDWCRNPMHLGYNVVAFSGIFFLNSLSALVFTFPLLIIGESIHLICFEGPTLKQRFGKNYIDYCKKTPFLLPRLKKTF